MVSDVKVRVLSADISRAVDELVAKLPANGDFSDVTRAWAVVLKSGAQLRFRAQAGPDGQAWKKSRRTEGGGQTLSLTRRLRNSITSAYSGTTATVGTNVVYAAIHQFGGTIRAKKGPFLAIPISDQARSAGSPRNFPQALEVWQTVKGQFVLGTRDGKGETVHYLLRASVTMPARPFLGASEADQAQLVRVVQDALANAWKRR